MNKPRLSNSTVPDPADHELDPLLSGPFADAWAVTAPPSTAPVRTRLLARASASQQAQAGMVTVRRRRMVSQSLGQGLAVRSAYLAPAPATLRAGEPLRVRLIELPAGAELGPEHLGGEAELASRHREWLVLSGRVTQGLLALSTRDYLVTPQGHATPRWRADSDTQLFLRESSVAAMPATARRWCWTPMRAGPSTPPASAAACCGSVTGRRRCCTTPTPARRCRTTSMAMTKSA
jgi:hypothetical protein